MNPTSDIPIANLRANLNGTVIAPDDPGYDDARRVFFTGFDRRHGCAQSSTSLGSSPGVTGIVSGLLTATRWVNPLMA